MSGSILIASPTEVLAAPRRTQLHGICDTEPMRLLASSSCGAFATGYARPTCVRRRRHERQSRRLSRSAISTASVLLTWCHFVA